MALDEEASPDPSALELCSLATEGTQEGGERLTERRGGGPYSMALAETVVVSAVRIVITI